MVPEEIRRGFAPRAGRTVQVPRQNRGCLGGGQFFFVKFRKLLESFERLFQAPGPAKPKEVDPWALVDEPDLSVPECKHGPMRRKTGLKKDGTPYAGYVCPVGGEGERCEAKWDRS